MLNFISSIFCFHYLSTKWGVNTHLQNKINVLIKSDRMNLRIRAAIEVLAYYLNQYTVHFCHKLCYYE